MLLSIVCACTHTRTHTHTHSSELALLLGNMVRHQHAKQAADIIYSFYCDDSNEGRMYHVSAWSN